MKFEGSNAHGTGTQYEALDFCAAGVPYRKMVPLSNCACPDEVAKWINLEDGSISETAPANAVGGTCADVPGNTKMCFKSGDDVFTQLIVSGVTTYFKNGFVQTTALDIAVAKAVVDNSTYENVVCCPECQPQVEATVQPTPTATGNTTNLNRVFKDASGVTWFVDVEGNAISLASPDVAPVFALSLAALDAGTKEGQFGYVTSTGAADGVISEVYTWVDGAWSPYPVAAAFKHSKEWHVDPVNGLDTNSGAEDAPFKTVTKALTAAGNTGEKIVMHAGTTTENVTVTQLNLDIVAAHGTLSGVCYIKGTVTVASNSTAASVRLGSVMVDTVIHTGTAHLVFNEANVKLGFSKTGTGAVSTYDSYAVGASITGAGQVNFYDSQVTGLTVSNAGATVVASNCPVVVAATVTAGTFAAINGTTCFATTAGGNAVTSSAGSIAIIRNSGCYDPTGAATKVALAGFYSLDDAIFNKTASTLGTNLGVVSWFDDAGFVNVPTITSATKALVLDSAGRVCEQLFPAGGGTGNALVVYVNATTPAAATIFDTANPPVTNDDALKLLDNAIYIGTDGSTWNSNGTTYATYTPPAATEFMLAGSTADAGPNKTGAIYRRGRVLIAPLPSTETAALNDLDVAGSIGFNIRSTTATAVTRLATDLQIVMLTTGAVYTADLTLRNVVYVRNGSNGLQTITGHINGIANNTITLPSGDTRRLACDGFTNWLM